MFGVLTLASWKLHLRVKNFGPSKSDAQIDKYTLLPMYQDSRLCASSPIHSWAMAKS